MSSKRKPETQPETETQTETTQPEPVKLAELHSALKTRAEEMRAEEIEADRIKARALIELDDIEGAAGVIGTAATLAALTVRSNEAAQAIAEAIDNDQDPTEAIEQRRKATARLASLASIEERPEPTYTLPDLSALAAATVLRAMAATLPDDQLGLAVEIDDTTRAAILAAVGRAITPTGAKESKTRSGQSNRRGPRFLAAYVAGETFVLSHGNGSRYELSGTIAPDGELVATHLKDMHHPTIIDAIPLKVGQQFGASHPTLTTLTAHATAYGIGIVGSPSALAKALASDEGSTAKDGPSESGYRVVTLTSGPGAGQTLNDYVPFQLP